MWCCPTSASSATAGAAGTPRWGRSTSPRAWCAGASSGWREAGVSGPGPTALLACLPGELHDLGLIAFGLALRSRGWRVVYLGPDTPIETVEDAADRLRPDVLVFHAVSSDRVLPVLDRLHELGDRHRVALGGAAATSAGLDPDRVLLLTGDPIAEAAALRPDAR